MKLPRAPRHSCVKMRGRATGAPRRHESIGNDTPLALHLCPVTSLFHSALDWFRGSAVPTPAFRVPPGFRATTQIANSIFFLRAGRLGTVIHRIILASPHPLDSFARTLATRVLPGPRRSRWTHLTYTSLATCRNPGGTSRRGPAHTPVLGGRDTQENHRVCSHLITMVALFRAPGRGFKMPRTDEGSGVPAGRQAQR